MKHFSNVVWFEGMYLGPQHFQVQNRAFENLVHFSASSLCFEPYGLIGQTLDGEALRNGSVALVHSRGIFPDGLAFDMPECDALPLAREIGDAFPPTRESLLVLFAVPAHRDDGPNCAMNPEDNFDHMRYMVEAHILHDENTGIDEKEIQLGRKRIRFL